MQKNELTMWEKISMFPVTAKMAIEMRTKQLFEDFKNDESGLEVVQTVLVVLVGVLLIAGLWAVLQPWLDALWKTIIDKGTLDEKEWTKYGG